MLDDLGMFVRFCSGLVPFLSEPLNPVQCRMRVADAFAIRNKSFLHLIKRGIFENSKSPYRKLFGYYGCEFGDVEKLILSVGIEETLDLLYEEGVRITLDEFKGKKTIRRHGLEIEVTDNDFDNPLMTKHYEGTTGGSRGVGRRLVIDLNMLAHEAAHLFLHYADFGVIDHPTALWLTVPPGTAGMKSVLRHLKAGMPVEIWFSHTTPFLQQGNLKPYIFLNTVNILSRILRTPFVVPNYTPLSDALRVIHWLETIKRKGQTPTLLTTVGSGTRACITAKDKGIDISGTFLRVMGEPLTPKREQIFAQAGCQVRCSYSMSETGIIALPCNKASQVDDVHVLQDKIALIEKEIPVGENNFLVNALYITTLMTASPKIMLNVESGDQAVMERRDCTCTLGKMGFDQHLHTIRSYEKLTSEGMTFYGEDLIRLIEQILPQQYGGNPTDYQFVEEEIEGQLKVQLYVSPRIGNIDNSKLTNTVLNHLAKGHNYRKMMTEVWKQSQTVQITRREPLSTSVAKILPLHILRNE